MQTYTYAEADREFIGLIKSKASSWTRPTALPFDDLVQEGRIILAKTLQSYNPQRGPLIKFLGVALDNRYRTIGQAVKAQIRMPYIWERDLETDEWVRVPFRPTSISAGTASDESNLYSLLSSDQTAQEHMSTASGIDDDMVSRENRTELAKWRMALENRLSDRQRLVFDTYTRPPSALVAVARNMSGESSPVVTIPHLAAYLGMTKNQIDYALHGVRKAAEVLFSETEPAAVESIRQALNDGGLEI